MLEVQLGLQYTLSVESLLDRFDQSKQFRKKSKKKFWDIQLITPHLPSDILWRPHRGRPENVLGTFRINLPATSLNVRIGRLVEVISGRPQHVRSGRLRESQIRSVGNALGMLVANVFRTSWGPIVADWDVSLIQNASYPQSPEKTKNNGEDEKRDNINTWVSWGHSLML